MSHAITTHKLYINITPCHCHSRTHAFKIKDPTSEPIMAKIRGYIKEWTEHDAQFDLRDGIFTVQPTSVFLAINAGLDTYCKLVIKKDGSPEACAGVAPSAMLLKFLKAYPDIMELLDEDTISLGINKEVAEIHLPQVWAEPIPGPM